MSAGALGWVMAVALGGRCGPRWALGWVLGWALGWARCVVACLVACVWQLGHAVAAPHTLVTLEVDLRAEIAAGRFDPARDTLGLRGNHPPLGWQHSLQARALGTDKPGRYGLDVAFDTAPPGGQALQYKFRIERAGQRGDEGWELGRNRALVLSAARVQVSRAFNDPIGPEGLSRVGTIDRLGAIASRHVAAREVQVWLPPSYASSAPRRYPVLYLHDGQNVFDAEASGAEWQADETAQRLALAGAIDEPIIVAVAHGADRGLDYTPSRVLLPAERTGTGRAQWMGGGVAAYGQFLAEELKPLIDARYRTKTAKADTAVGGSSFGGLASLWLALHRSDVFGAALVVSPSLWWDDRFVYRDVQAWRGTSRARIWLDMGGNEGPGALPAAAQLHQALQARGWPDGALRYVEDMPGGHDEASWAARFEGMLRFLYPRPPA